jgi:hypothetical protein
LCFRKATQKIFSELDETSLETPIFPDRWQGPNGSRRGARGWPHHRGRGPAPGRAHPWWARRGHLLTMPLRL